MSFLEIITSSPFIILAGLYIIKTFFECLRISRINKSEKVILERIKRIEERQAQYSALLHHVVVPLQELGIINENLEVLWKPLNIKDDKGNIWVS